MQSRSVSTWRLLVFTALVLGLWAAGPIVGFVIGRKPTALAAAEVVLTVAWVGCAIGLVSHIAALELSFWMNVAGLALSVLIILPLALLHLWQPFGGIAIIFAASFFGCVVAVIFRDPNIMLPIALISPMVDYWTVVYGPVRQIIAGSPATLAHVSAGIPGTVSLHPIAFIGAGDFLFMAMFLSAAQRLRMSPVRTAWLFLVLVSLSMVVVVTLDVSKGMPGMVAIGLAFIAANIRHFKLSRSETAMTVGLALFMAIMVVFTGLKGVHH